MKRELCDGARMTCAWRADISMKHSQVLHGVTQGALLNTHIHAHTERTIYGRVRRTSGLLIKINERTSPRHSETDAVQSTWERPLSFWNSHLAKSIAIFTFHNCTSKSCQEYRLLFMLICNKCFFLQTLLLPSPRFNGRTLIENVYHVIWLGEVLDCSYFFYFVDLYRAVDLIVINAFYLFFCL